MLVPDAVIRGAVLALTIVVPAAALQLLIDAPSVRWLLFAVILGGFGAGGHRASRLAPATPLTNAAAALAAFVVAQGVAAALSVARGSAVQWAAIAFLALLATSSGMVGAMVSLRRGSSGRSGGRSDS
jgi:hypothetical protein